MALHSHYGRGGEPQRVYNNNLFLCVLCASAVNRRSVYFNGRVALFSLSVLPIFVN